jgi:hypothetical protein
MKKIIFFSVITLLLITSCKKSSQMNPVASNVITATIDGTNCIFNIALETQTNNDTSGTVFIAYEVDSSFDFLNFKITSKNKIALKTYGESADSTAEIVMAYRAGNTATNYFNAYNTQDPFTITVTAVSGTLIQGTFAGNLYANGISTTAPKVITNGTFSISR